jgi:pilus assembly protein Flp/PilA
MPIRSMKRWPTASLADADRALPDYGAFMRCRLSRKARKPIPCVPFGASFAGGRRAAAINLFPVGFARHLLVKGSALPAIDCTVLHIPLEIIIHEGNGYWREPKLQRHFLSDESGATAIEYGLIAAGISLAIIAIVNGLGANLSTSSPTSIRRSNDRAGVPFLRGTSASGLHLHQNLCGGFPSHGLFDVYPKSVLAR